MLQNAINVGYMGTRGRIAVIPKGVMDRRRHLPVVRGYRCAGEQCQKVDVRHGHCGNIRQSDRKGSRGGILHCLKSNGRGRRGSILPWGKNARRVGDVSPRLTNGHHLEEVSRTNQGVTLPGVAGGPQKLWT